MLSGPLDLRISFSNLVGVRERRRFFRSSCRVAVPVSAFASAKQQRELAAPGRAHSACFPGEIPLSQRNLALPAEPGEDAAALPRAAPRRVPARLLDVTAT